MYEEPPCWGEEGLVIHIGFANMPIGIMKVMDQFLKSFKNQIAHNEIDLKDAKTIKVLPNLVI